MDVLFIIIGCFLIIMGGMVWRYKLLELVSQYKEDSEINRDGLARWIGINYILLGILINVNSVISMMIEQISDLITITIFTFLIYLFVISLIYGGNRYNKRR